MAKQIYCVYKNGELLSEGTIHQVVKETLLKPSTIQSYADKTKTNPNLKWKVLRKNNFVDTDIFKIVLKMNEFGYETKDLAEALGITETSVRNKLYGKTRFWKSEVEELEDLFFLDDGELIKGE